MENAFIDFMQAPAFGKVPVITGNSPGFHRNSTGILPNRLPEFTGVLPESQ